MRLAFFNKPANGLRNTHLMADIETLDTETTANVLSIGAVMFDPFHLDTPESIRDNSFYEVIDQKDGDRLGLTTSKSTLEWWEQQSPEAREVLDAEGIPVYQAADKFRRFIQDSSFTPSHIWAKDPDFDCKILEHMFKTAEVKWPFMFFQYRSVRTIEDIAYPNGPLSKPDIRIGAHHNALDDSVTQALSVQLCMFKLGLNQTRDERYKDIV